MNSSVSVRQILRTEAFQNSNVIAGNRGLDRRITRITVSELPNAPKWISGGEIVCSTGYHFQENPEGQLEWIAEMNRHGVSAMVIKPHGFLGELSQKIIELADEVGLPIIVLPTEVTWACVIASVMDTLLSIQTKRMLESYDIHHRLVKLVLSSGGLEMILKAISQIASSAAIVEDRFFKTMAVESPSDGFREEYVAARLSDETKSKLRKQFGINAPGSSAVITTPLPAHKGEKTLVQTMVPLVAGECFFGWLTLLPVEEENRVFSETVCMQGAISIALELLIQMTGVQSRFSELHSFFDIFLNRINVSPSEFKRQGSLIGLDWHQPACVFVLVSKTEFSLLNFRQIDVFVKKEDPHAVVYSRANEIIIIYHPKYTSSEKATLAECRRIAQNILETIKSDSYTCNIGIGSVSCSSPDALKNSFSEAKECVTKGKKDNLDICTHDQLGIERLFPLFTDIDELASFANKFLSPLLEYDADKNSEMVKTLTVFLKNKFNKAKSANDLCIHINTLNYRLAKIQEMLNIDFENMESCTMLYLALKIMGMT